MDFGTFGSAIPEQQKVAEEYARAMTEARIASLERDVAGLIRGLMALMEAHKSLVQTLTLAACQPKEDERIN